MTNPPWLQKIETSHQHMKAFLAPPVPQEALRNMDMVLEVLSDAYRRMSKIAEMDAHDPERRVCCVMQHEAMEFLNYNPEVKHD